MKVSVLLADAAQADNLGKVHALGLGWTETGSPLPAMALVILVDVGWDETNTDFDVAVELVDADGHPVTTQGPLGEAPVRIDAKGQAGRPPGAQRGSDVRVPLAINLPPGLPLAPGQSYEWRTSVTGAGEAETITRFMVRRDPGAVHPDLMQPPH